MRFRPEWKVLAAAIGLMVGADWALAATPSKQPDPTALEFFEKKVRPILVSNCYTCHSANTNSKGGLRVDDRNALPRMDVVHGEIEKERAFART